MKTKPATPDPNKMKTPAPAPSETKNRKPAKFVSLRVIEDARHLNTVRLYALDETGAIWSRLHQEDAPGTTTNVSTPWQEVVAPKPN